jgi:Double-GTPase 2
MNSLFAGSSAKRFNVLVMGQRSAGKTVFLAGSYAALQDLSQRDRGPLWFDCQTDQDKADIEAILNYVASRGAYPPATMKIRDFDFSLKRRWLLGTETLCHFCWHDIPGEICTPENKSFREIVLSSHACCFFIDGYSLVNEESYMKRLNDLIKQIQIIASLAYLNDLKYAFSLVITKTDLIKSDTDGKDWKLKVEQSLKPLIEVLKGAMANYKVFYSVVLIDTTTHPTTLKTDSGAVPMLWLINELFQAYDPLRANNPGIKGNILSFINRLAWGKEAIQEPVELGPGLFSGVGLEFHDKKHQEIEKSKSVGSKPQE